MFIMLCVIYCTYVSVNSWGSADHHSNIANIRSFKQTNKH